MLSKLRVGVVQMRFGRSIGENLAKIENAVGEASRKRADVVLFPEAATTGYGADFAQLKRTDIREALTQVGSVAKANHIHVLIGSPVFRKRGLCNCLVQFDRDGRAAHCYAKCQLTPSDQKVFRPGNSVSLFHIDGVCVTSIICHERRYPELVRLACMAGAKVLFHPNAGMDTLAVSKKKRLGKDGIAIRAFENAIYYVFANSVGPQGGGRWSAGDSKIVAPDMRVIRLADNQSECLLVADLDLNQATRKYPVESMEYPRFLSPVWKQLVRQIKRESQNSLTGFDLP